jgi:hypothetical protein
MADTETTKPMKSPRELTLNRSKLRVVFDQDYTAVDTIAAQKAAGKDTGAFPLYLAQRICLFDGKKMTIGDIRQLPGRDYLQLVGELLSDGESEEAGADPDLGKLN